MRHPHTFQVMQTQSGTSSVLKDHIFDDIKVTMVIDTLLVIPEGENFKPRQMETFLMHTHTFQVMQTQSGTFSVRNHDLKDRRNLDTL